MNISGIRPSMGFYDYNSIRINQSLNIGSFSQEPVEEPKEAAPKVSDEEIAAARAKQTFGIYDYANQYKPGEIYDMKGADADIKSLDVVRAVGEMQKDSLIQQYQYFVGDKAAGAEQQAIRGVENFTL